MIFVSAPVSMYRRAVVKGNMSAQSKVDLLFSLLVVGRLRQLARTVEQCEATGCERGEDSWTCRMGGGGSVSSQTRNVEARS